MCMFLCKHGTKKHLLIYQSPDVTRCSKKGAKLPHNCNFHFNVPPFYYTHHHYKEKITCMGFQNGRHAFRSSVILETPTTVPFFL